MTDEEYMREALRVARFSEGRTSPNPLVGALIVKDERIIAVGWHRMAGTEHAEIHALNMAGELAKGATLYVTLEPCSHYGKVPPCAIAIVKAGIKRVVMAMIDPNPKVSGKGKKILEDSGVEVACGVLQKDAERLNEVFLKWITAGKPWVTLKTAMTLDGKIATKDGKSKWITNDLSRKKVHDLRDNHDAILVGIGTIIADNPYLTTRLQSVKGKNPIRVIIDSKAHTPLTSNVITDKQAKTIIATTASASPERILALKNNGTEVIVVNEKGNVDLEKLLTLLGQRGITSLLVEGGGTVNYSFLAKSLIDKVYAFIAPKLFGGKDSLTPVEGDGVSLVSEAFELNDIEITTYGDNICVSGYIRK